MLPSNIVHCRVSSLRFCTVNLYHRTSSQELEYFDCRPFLNVTNSSSRMCFMSHNWSATKQRLHPQTVAEISRHSVLSVDRI